MVLIKVFAGIVDVGKNGSTENAFIRHFLNKILTLCIKEHILRSIHVNMDHSVVTHTGRM